ncbi:MAG: hypothetical protein ABF743_10995 [Schleiferilactobacillus perolens]|uniref:hypothetical protein n=1 Tax=Schleiferilactobacillus perolens TaxID=100468 RepID=UPI0039E8D809
MTEKEHPIPAGRDKRIKHKKPVKWIRNEKQWTDYLMLGVPGSVGTFRGVKQVIRWKFVGTVLPDAVDLIKRRPKREKERADQ